MFSTLQLGPLIQSCIESKKKCWYFNISILGGENNNWNNDLCQVDFTVCFYKGDAVTFVNFGYFFNARFETRLNRLFGEKEGGRVGGEEGEIAEAVGGSKQGEVQQHLHRMGGSTIYGGNSTPLQGGEGEREGRENSCNGLFRFTFKKYIEKQFSSMRGKTQLCAWIYYSFEGNTNPNNNQWLSGYNNCYHDNLWLNSDHLSRKADKYVVRR